MRSNHSSVADNGRKPSSDARTQHTNGDDGSLSEGGSHPHERDYTQTPLVVVWEVTQACDLACDHCRAAATKQRHPDELSTDEAVELFEDIESFSPQPYFVLSGGDPLHRPDLFELLEMAVDTGITPSITPATTPRLTRETIARFADIGVGRMALSLDGATADSHDAFRGESGTFETVIQAAETARELGLPIQINTTVTAATVGELPAIADLVEQLGARMWEVFFLVPIGRGSDLSQISPQKAREITEWLYTHSRDASYQLITVEAPFYRRVAQEIATESGDESPRVGSTGAGNGFVFVSHTGDVYPSGFMPLQVGNVRETPLSSIYRTAEPLQALRNREAFDGPCGDCPATQSCGGSRSRAYAVTGNPTGSDPLCPWVRDQQSTVDRDTQ